MQLSSLFRVGVYVSLAAACCPYSAWAQASYTTFSPTDGTTPNMIAPGSPDGSYATSNIDTVNLANGRLNVAIPLLEVPGRGSMKVPIVINIQSHWNVNNASPATSNGTHYTTYLPYNNPWEQNSPGLAQGVMIARYAGSQCSAAGSPGAFWTYTLTRLNYISPDGTEHEFRDVITGGQAELETSGSAFNRGTQFRAFDGSGAVFTTKNSSGITDSPGGCGNSEGPVPGIMTLRDGTQYVFDSNGYVSQIEDRNGNTITFTGDGSNSTTNTITDPLGRGTTITNCTGSPCTDTIMYPAFNNTGTQPVISIKYDTLGNHLAAGSVLEPVVSLSQSSPGLWGITVCSVPTPPGANCTDNVTMFDPTIVSEVDLPNSQKYTFTYTPYGEVSEITLPTGGAYKYTWECQTVQTSGSCSIETGGSDPNLQHVLVNRVLTKSIFTNSTDSTAAQTIAYTYTPGSPEVTTVVYSGPALSGENIGPNGQLGQEKHSFSPISVLPPVYSTDYTDWEEGKELASAYYDVNGTNPTLLKYVYTTWTQRPCITGEACWFDNAATGGDGDNVGNPHIVTASVSPAHDPRAASTEVTLSPTTTSTGGQTYRDAYTYSNDEYNNVTEDKQFDFGTFSTSGSFSPGALTKDIKTTYQTLTTWTDLNLVSLPAQITVYDGNSDQYSQTTYTYDGYTSNTITPYSSVIQHDSSNYGSTCTGVTNTPCLYRGNPTSIQRSISGSSVLTSNYYYDILGNVVSTVDPRGVEVDYGFVDMGENNPSAGSYALLTSITSYPVLSSKQTKLQAMIGYDYASGKTVSTTDVNGNTTKYSYADPFYRLTQAVRSDSSQTNVSYDDVPGSLNDLVKEDQVTVGDAAIQTTTTYDGLGRKSSTQQSEPNSKAITVCYGYDGRGRRYEVSNPYDTSPVGTCSSNYTVTAFDGMGRPISLTQPGSAVTSSAYAGDQTLVTDPAGVLKLVATDRFGRVTSVNENPTGAWNGGSNAGGTGTTYTTSYMYDPLDDLTNVAQGSLKARVFQYDWLKRLMSANNPESGTITYMYDASSNLMQRVDALNVTTTYAYDGMNRAVSKIYSGGTTATPSVLYCYDGAISSNGNTSCNGTLTGSNLKGQMTYVGTSSSMTEYTNFDSVRRLLSSMQSTGGSNYLFSYTYNLASDLSTETYPSGRQITYAYDVANRVTSAMGLFNTVTTPYASNVTYAPQGPISTLQMGSGVTEAWTFDGVRQQPISMTATLAGTQLLNLGWSWVPTVNSKPATQYDNGNLLSASTTRNVNSTSYTYSQAYTYDAYNRLTSATETNGWTQTYNYDAYGNRAVTAASYIPNMSLTPTALTQFNGNNQWTGGTSSAGYDNSGNQIADNGTGNAFTYDAENRMVTANVAATGNVNYVYDGAGKRVQKYWTSSTCTGSLCSTTYVYDGMGQLAAEYSDLTGSATGTEYLSVDTLGSTRLITNNAGGSPECLDYLPFGEEVPGGENGRPSCYTSGAYPNSPDPEGSRKFTGKERDAETGLDYFGARYMSSAQGRFTSPDPKQEPHDITDPQSWNKYAYTRNNPLRYTDPDGEDFWDAVKGTINAFTSDNAFGAGRINSGNSDFHTGQAVGDAIATVTGTAEALFGGGEAIVTSPAALTVAGAVIPAAGLTTAVHGGTTAAIAGSHLAAAAFADNNQQSSGEGSQLVGNNPRDAKGRTNTDLPGGHEAAKDTFGKLTSGQDVAVDPKTGHQVAADGTRLRLNPDGTARVDVPSSQTNPKRETVHFNNPDKPQQ